MAQVDDGRARRCLRGQTGAAGELNGTAVRGEKVDEHEGQIGRVLGQQVGGQGACFLSAGGPGENSAELADGDQPAFAEHSPGRFCRHPQNSPDASLLVVDRAEGEREVGLFNVAVTLQHQQEVLGPARLALAEHAFQHVADGGPELGEGLRGRLPDGRGMLVAQQGNRGVVVDHGQLRSPEDGQGGSGQQDHAHRRAQRAGPAPGHPQRRGPPVHRGDQGADLAGPRQHPPESIEGVVVARRFTALARCAHRSSSHPA